MISQLQFTSEHHIKIYKTLIKAYKTPVKSPFYISLKRVEIASKDLHLPTVHHLQPLQFQVGPVRVRFYCAWTVGTYVWDMWFFKDVGTVWLRNYKILRTFWFLFFTVLFRLNTLCTGYNINGFHPAFLWRLVTSCAKMLCSVRQTALRGLKATAPAFHGIFLGLGSHEVDSSHHIVPSGNLT